MERIAITVRGTVQGVGFRPFVHALASRLQLGGSVNNFGGLVFIQVEGEKSSLDRFLEELQERPPPLSRIDGVICQRQPLAGEREFRIHLSETLQSDDAGSSGIFISPDVATCPECLAELFDPADRRYRYPFLNCTNCGPRLTIVRGAPYDRERTTMAAFVMCGACKVEYDDPRDRRFHAQPTACPECGPRLCALGRAGVVIETADPLALFVAALREGRIGALKGLGGYHLACDASNEDAVRRLRQRKERDEKPFAVMVRNADSAARLCELSAAERALLESPRRPIVLLRRSAPPERTWGSMASAAAPGPVRRTGPTHAVAPGNPYLGVMLPYTPLHQLLMEAMGDTPLVMTSGNRSDEPIAYLDEDVVERLSGIADLFLTHDRPIHVRCDDSVTRVVDGVELPVRRSRGYAPRTLKLAHACGRPTLAVGGQLKAVFALGRERHAFLSHHLGDLDHFQAYRAFERDVRLYEELFDIRPEVIVHDLHPDYLCTGYALRRAAEEGLAPVAVQHHHAHMAACMAEHQLSEPVIGVTFDGTGYGTDGAIWGGEFLVGDCREFRRAAHLRYVGMPGGEQVIREPWRMALAHLIDAGCGDRLLASRIDRAPLRTAARMIERQLNTPSTSSMGRLFDAVAALAGVRDHVTYEGRAAVELEWLAAGVPPDGSYPFDLVEAPEGPDEGGEVRLIVDTRPLIHAVAEDVARETGCHRVARRFHSTLVELVASVCGEIRNRTSWETVVLSGGVFLNVLLTREVMARLESEGFRVFRHREVPPGDGGLCLGQLAVAAARAEDVLSGASLVQNHVLHRPDVGGGGKELLEVGASAESFAPPTGGRMGAGQGIHNTKT